MLTLFVILMFLVFGGLIWLGLKLTWCLWKWVVTLLCLPAALILLVCSGALMLAFPVLLAIGLVCLILAKPVIPAAVFWTLLILALCCIGVLMFSGHPYPGMTVWMV